MVHRYALSEPLMVCHLYHPLTDQETFQVEERRWRMDSDKHKGTKGMGRTGRSSAEWWKFGWGEAVQRHLLPVGGDDER